MIFPDGCPDPIPTPQPVTSCDNLRLVKSSPEMSSEGPEAALGRLEGPKSADDASHAAPSKQTAVPLSSTDQLSSPQNLETTLQNNGDGVHNEELPIGTALGDPGEDSALNPIQQDTVHHDPSVLKEHSGLPTKEASSAPTRETSRKRDLRPVPTPHTVTFDPSHTAKPSTASPSSMAYADRQRKAPGLATMNTPLNRKPSRWNILGGLFGKKNFSPSPAATQIYQMQDGFKPASQHKDNVLIGTESLGVVPKGKDRFHRSRSSSTRLTKSKGGTRPAFGRTRTAPTPHPPEVDPSPSSKGSNADDTFPELQLDGQPMLSVDIPNIQLDRYSVMFGGLLQPTPPAPAQPSLLVRRQAHLKNVETNRQDGEVLFSPTV